MESKSFLTSIFFLPLSDRPKKFPLLKFIKGKFWHTGIIYKDKVYETFNHNKWKISDLSRLNDPEFKNAIYLDYSINTKKLVSELKSRTDCAEYVARVSELSNRNGSNKGNLWPEDVYNLMK